MAGAYRGLRNPANWDLAYGDNGGFEQSKEGPDCLEISFPAISTDQYLRENKNFYRLASPHSLVQDGWSLAVNKQSGGKKRKRKRANMSGRVRMNAASDAEGFAMNMDSQSITHSRNPNRMLKPLARLSLDGSGTARGPTSYFCQVGK